VKPPAAGRRRGCRARSDGVVGLGVSAPGRSGGLRIGEAAGIDVEVLEIADVAELPRPVVGGGRRGARGDRRPEAAVREDPVDDVALGGLDEAADAHGRAAAWAGQRVDLPDASDEGAPALAGASRAGCVPVVGADAVAG